MGAAMEVAVAIVAAEDTTTAVEEATMIGVCQEHQDTENFNAIRTTDRMQNLTSTFFSLRRIRRPWWWWRRW